MPHSDRVALQLLPWLHRWSATTPSRAAGAGLPESNSTQQQQQKQKQKHVELVSF
jgi:hypothetical protein